MTEADKDAVERAVDRLTHGHVEMKEPTQFVNCADLETVLEALARQAEQVSDDAVERAARAVIVHNRQMVGSEADYAEADRILASNDAGDAGEAFAARELSRAALTAAKLERE